MVTVHYILVGTMTESEIETTTGTEPYTRYHNTSLVRFRVYRKRKSLGYKV